MRRPGLALASVVMLIAGGAAACFSERTVAAVEEGECRFPVGEGVPGSTVVVIRRFAFNPEAVRIGVGERVTWINCDEDPHTSTADGGEWASPLLVPGDAYTRAFDEPGTFPYHCEPHPFMQARVIVE